MTFADLLTTLEGRAALPAGRLKDCKTSLRYLAQALGSDAVDDACQKEATWAVQLEAHFATLTALGRTISAATRRNTRNNCRLVFRAAEAHGLLKAPLPTQLLTKPSRTAFERQYYATAPYQTTYHLGTPAHRYRLPYAQWPADIQAGWQAYRTAARRRLRESTFTTYVRLMGTYLGWHVNICGRTPTWEHLFDPAALSAFVDWHADRMQRPISAHGRLVACTIAAMAVVLARPEKTALAALRNALPEAERTHDKRQHHWISLAELDAVAEACLAEGRLPYDPKRHTRTPGLRRISQFQRGVILKLLVRVPLRQRNVREMRLRENLFKDRDGHWQLRFVGRELKIGHRGREGVNTYEVNLATYRPDFIPVLEEWLDVHRRRIPGADDSPFVFLTLHGKPFTVSCLGVELKLAVSLRTGIRFYPHLIRTIWATEFLEKKQDFAAAATLLGDTLAVVMSTYYNVPKKDQHAKASAFLTEALHTG